MKILTIAVILSLACGAHAAEFRDLAVKASDLKTASDALAAVRPERAAGTNVITIYFCGTAITKEWWKGSDAHSPDGASGFWSPELVSTLFHEQDNDSYKLVVNGIGTDDVPGYASSPAVKTMAAGRPAVNSIGNKGLYGQAFPGSMLADRGWETCIGEAEAYINSVLSAVSGDVTLNLVGHSRGGVLTIMTADRVKDNPRIKAVNVLALDPVPGDGSVPEGTYLLNEKVKNYVGIYSEDERTEMFEPVIPAAESKTKVWLLTLPGSHEAMVGNSQKDGHSSGDHYYSSDKADGNTHLPELEPVGRLTKIIASELLASQDWGAVRFERTWRRGTIEESKADLIKTAREMRSAKAEKLYEYQRTVSFLPSLIPFYTPLVAFTGGAARQISDSEADAGLQNEPRAVYKFEGGAIRTMALNEAVPGRETAGQIVEKLAEFGGLN